MSRISGGLALACWTCGERLRCQLGFILGESCVPRQTFREGVVDSCALKRDWRAPTRITYFLKHAWNNAFNMPSICFRSIHASLVWHHGTTQFSESQSAYPCNSKLLSLRALWTVQICSDLFRFVQLVGIALIDCSAAMLWGLFDAVAFRRHDGGLRPQQHGSRHLVGLHRQGVATLVTLPHFSPPFTMLCSVAINLDLFDLSNLVGSEINENQDATKNMKI